jgi:putative transposase
MATKNHQRFFGEVRNGIVGLSEIGNTACLFLQKIPEVRTNVDLGEFIIMPDHIHCILNLKKQDQKIVATNQFGKPVQGSISVIINQYKGAVSKWCLLNGYPDFLWKPRFYDHVIRNHEDYLETAHYIKMNPKNWEKHKPDRFDLPPANLV